MNSSTDLNRLEQAIQLFADLIAKSDPLEQEFIGSRREFLGTVPEGKLGESDLEALFDGDATRAWRHLEWFIFDRQSASLDALPVETLHTSWSELVVEQLDEMPVNMLQSVCGIFEILEVHSDGQIDLRDLAGLNKLSMRDRTGGGGYGLGDLLVGRFYPSEADGLHRPSPAIVSFRDIDLLSALRADIERLRESRSHAVMHMSQLELERMFWATDLASESAKDKSASAKENTKDPVGEMERFFLDNDVSPQALNSWKRALERTPQDPKALTSAHDDLVGGLLDQLAFETSLDLGQARAHLVAAWSALRAQVKVPHSTSETVQDETTTDVLESLQELDSDRAAGLDLDASFTELERRLGLDSIPEEDTGDAPDFPGVVGAMVEEFVWESGLDNDTDDQNWPDGLRMFAEYTAKIGVFENLTERDVLSFLTFWLPESRRLLESESAVRMVRSIYAFATWAQTAHCVSILGEELANAGDAMEQDMARVTAANAGLSNDGDQAGELFECCGPCDHKSTRIRDEQGEERDVRFTKALVQPLENGDLLRGYTADDGTFVIGCCYPPQARGLRQSTASDQ